MFAKFIQQLGNWFFVTFLVACFTQTSNFKALLIHLVCRTPWDGGRTTAVCRSRLVRRWWPSSSTSTTSISSAGHIRYVSSTSRLRSHLPGTSGTFLPKVRILPHIPTHQRRFPNHFLSWHRVTRSRFWRVSYHRQSYSVLPCCDGDLILLLLTLTPGKVGFVPIRYSLQYCGVTVLILVPLRHHVCVWLIYFIFTY